MTPAFDTLLGLLRETHSAYPALTEFCRFPDDLTDQPCPPVHRPCADVLAAETMLEAGPLTALRDAMCAVSADASWRDTYAGTGIGEEFMERFACYCIIGSGGPWISAQMSGYMVYQPANFWYPWHHHPAEEMYFVVAGEAEFLRNGMPTETLRPGDTCFHESNQPHALQTRDKPVMAYVLWRNNLGIKPVLTPSELLV